MRVATKLAAVVVLGLSLSACVSVPQPDPNDPFESYNRTMFEVNEALDGAILKPVTRTYEVLVPNPVRTCVSNIFGNLGDVWSGFNSMLQGRGLDAVNTFGRVLFNTTVGLGGCIDVASMNGAHKIRNDFGTTLAVWGAGEGDYLVLPAFGSSNFRDTGGLVVDSMGKSAAYLSPWSIDNVKLRNPAVGLGVIDSRAALLDADELADNIALDKYSFVRDAYLQNRRALVEQKMAPEITDGTQVPAWSAEDDQRYGPGEDMFQKATIDKYRPTTDDLDYGALPSYDDPDANSVQGVSSGLPQYADPEDDAAPTTSAPGTSLPQYDDPDA
ncbi:MAG: VacJ family lipoprotein [Alcaligenaceae bacterium]|nr:VacJ family lipoprotein [Alcaligenaceae bacterium]